MKNRIEHECQGTGNICTKCFKPRRLHRERNREREYHEAVGNPCERCGKPASIHVSKVSITARKGRDSQRIDRQSGRVIIGIDGEGFDLPNGRHIYTLLSAVDEHGRVVGEVENLNGLSTYECCKMLLSLPKNSLKFVFMGSYDWTKIIEDLDPVDIYHIMHPDSRRMYTCQTCKYRWKEKKEKCPRCTGVAFRSVLQFRRVEKDKNSNVLNLGFDWFNGSFSIAECSVHNVRKYVHKVKVWDCFKFFQSSFVKAIEDWGIGTKEQQTRIAGMKAKRGSFDEEKPEDVRMYCREECHLLAQMMRKLISACEAANIDLKRYDGAGAIANSLLRTNKIKEFLGPPLESYPDKMYHAVMSAYFGGRFENSIVGAIEVPVYNQDINSAYPYALSMLPCLECGKWHRVLKNVLDRARSATLAVIKYRVKPVTFSEREAMAWAPFPFRDNDGSICYPVNSSGWAWLPEFEAGIRGWEKLIDIQEAWVYETDCDHKPWEWMPGAYRKRCEWGKDGPGKVMKLGTNACAGKTMQNAGDKPPFKSWIWGGMCTGTTRGQSLDAINVASNKWSVLAIATDGVFSTERLDLPKPKDTGTYDLKKPLGNWGCDVHENGVFFVKPGMYFDDAKSLMRARGIGRADLDKYALKLIDMFKVWDRESTLSLEVKSRRFYGAKSSILMFSNCYRCNKTWPGWPGKRCPECGKIGQSCRADGMKMQDGKTIAYGRWDARTIKIEFASLPKREAISKGGSYGRMRIRDMGGRESLPYMGLTSPQGMEAREANKIALEEPDWNDSEELIE